MRVILILSLWSLCFMGLAQHESHDHDHVTKDQITVIPGVDKFVTINFDNTNFRNSILTERSGSLPFDLGPAGMVQLDLEAYNMLSEDYFVQNESGQGLRSGDVTTLKGYSADGGKVRLTISEQFTYGFIEYSDETFWIEPAWYYIKEKGQTNDIVVYKQSDIDEDLDRMCGAIEATRKAENLRQRETTHQRSGQRLGQCYQVELAVASDYSMYVKYNSSSTNVENHNIAVINNVNGDYSGSFEDDIEFVIVTQWLSTCSSCDPWTTSTDAFDLLMSFSGWGQGGNFQTSYDLAELWTNRDFDGQTVGIAWVGGLCNNNRYHCFQDFTSNAGLLRVTASHEIGHNFDALHVTVDDFIMSEFVSITSDWHPNSINDISDFIALRASQGGCFSNCPVGSAPTPDMEPLANNICPGTTIKFFDRSLGDPSNWSWTFPGGNPSNSNDQNPTVTYDIQGTFPVILEVANTAGSNSQTFTNEIVVGDGGTSFLLYQDFDDGFEDWSIDNSDNGVTWELMDPTAAPGGTTAAFIDNFNYPNLARRDAMISPIFSLAGFQSATLHVEYAHAALTSGLRDSLILYVSGDAGQSFQRFYANAENGSGNFATRPAFNGQFDPQNFDEWCGSGSFGADCIDVDISNYLGSRDVIVRIENYTNSGNNTYVDRVYVKTNCFDLPPPVAEFSGQPVTGCAPLVVQFQDQSQNSPFAWNWTFENGSPATSSLRNPEVIFTNTGQHTVTLTVTNESGSDVEVKNGYIHVIDDPIAAFNFSAVGATVIFQNLSIDATDYLWNFGDGQMSADENPVHVYMADGPYDVTLQAFNDCGTNTHMSTVNIGTPPTAAYESTPLTGCAPLEVQFVSTSSVNTSDVQWIFEGGDPEFSNELDPLVTYEMAGVFDVVLIAINANGTDTLVDVDVITINEDPQADFSYTVDDLSVDFLNQSVGASNFDWFFGDGNVSMEENPSHTYSSDNQYEVVLIVSGNCGMDTVSQTIEAGNFPSSVFSANITEGCAPLTVEFEATDAGPTDLVHWMFEGGDPATSTLNNPVIVYDSPGSYDVSCIVSNVLGSDTTLLIDYVIVQGPPVPDFDAESDGFLTANLTYTGGVYDDILWLFGDGSSSTDENPSHIYDDAGHWEISCIVSNGCGSDTLVQEIIRTDPLVMIDGLMSAHCIGNSVQFSAMGVGNSPTFEWTFEGGDPSNSSLAMPLITYNQSGQFDVALVASQNGASFTYNWIESISIENEPEADFIVQLNQLSNTSLHATNYLWFVDENFVSDEEDYILSQEGEFEVMLIASNSCGSDTITQNVSVSATNELPLFREGMKIVPNPNDGFFTVVFDKTVGRYDLSIFNSSGKEVVSLEHISSETRSLMGLQNGFYLIRATTPDGIFITKMVVIK